MLKFSHTVLSGQTGLFYGLHEPPLHLGQIFDL